MKIQKSNRLFFGCKIDSKLREALAQAKPGDKRYFEDPEAPFLRIVLVEEERWIGKVIGAGINVTEVEDIQRNVTSILRRIAPNVRHSPTAVKIFVVDELAGDEVIDPVPVPVVDDAEVPEAAESTGPYIADY